MAMKSRPGSKKRAAPVPEVVKCSAQTAIRELWQPAMVAECVVPWSVIKEIGRSTPQTAQSYYKSPSEFLPPWDVYGDDDDGSDDDGSDDDGSDDDEANAVLGVASLLLFKIRFKFCSSTNSIEVTLQQQPASEGRPQTDLMVKSCVMWTERINPVNPDPLSWPVPKEKRVTHLILQNEMSCPTVELFKEPRPKTCCFSLRLEVYALKKYSDDSLSNSFNLARKSSSPFCDIQLRVDDQDFAAHKEVICASSPVFKTMFTGDFKEKHSNSVTIEAVSKKAFGKFLEFLYIKDIENWDGCELELLNLAELYQVPELKAQCEMALWVVDGPRALSIIMDMEANKWPISEDLKKRLFRLVTSNARAVVESREWETLQLTNPLASGIIQASAPIVEPTVQFFQPCRRARSCSPRSSRASALACRAVRAARRARFAVQ